MAGEVSRARCKNGASLAAAFSVLVGLLTLAFANLAAQASNGLHGMIAGVAVWLPGAGRLGAYLGMEVLSLLAWLGSWFILHRFWRHKDVEGMAPLIIFLAGMALATLLLWSPWVQLFLAKA